MTSHASSRVLRVLGSLAAGALVTGAVVLPAHAVTAPPAPKYPKATASSGAVTLTWKSGGGTTKGFNVYRSTTSSVSLTKPLNGSKLLSLSHAYFKSSGLTNGKSYWFVIQSVDASKHHRQTATLKATPKPAKPAAPKLLTATSTPGSGSVKLTWSAGTGGGAVASWRVYRSLSATGVVASANLVTSGLTPATLTYTDPGRTLGTTYYYAVLAVNLGGSTASGVLSCTPSSLAPGAITLVATPHSGSVHLAWSAGVGGTVPGWSIYRSTTTPVARTGPNLINSPATATLAYDDNGVSNGTKYYYVVSATNTGGTTVSNEANATPQIAAPNAPTLVATPGDGTVGLSWTAAVSGTAVASWRVYRSTTSPVSTSGTPLVSPALATTTYQDNAVTNGTTYFYKVVAVNAGGSTASTEKSATPDAVSAGHLTVTNPDAVPGSDRFVMSRMEYYNTPTSLVNVLDPDNGSLGTATWYRVHDVSMVHVTNTGTDPVSVTGLVISDVDSFTTTSTAPFTIPAGGSVDIPVRFVYKGGVVYGPVVRTATLTITATGLADTVVSLAGEWQPGASREPGLFADAPACSNTPPTTPCARPNFEASLSQVVNEVYGWTTDIGSTGLLNNNSSNFPFGEEHISRFWKAADTGQPVTVRRLGTFSGSGLAQISWYPQSQPTGCATPADGGCAQIYAKFKPAGATAVASDPATAAISQGILPLEVGDTLSHSFSPGSTPFGIQIISEFSDDARNDTTNDVALHLCAVNCGHHMRFFPVRDSNGVIVPNTWIETMDQTALNNDFNDQIVLFTNMAPVTP